MRSLAKVGYLQGMRETQKININCVMLSKRVDNDIWCEHWCMIANVPLEGVAIEIRNKLN
jgi:hypothetical protein